MFFTPKINQHLLRSTASGDEKNMKSIFQITLRLEKKQVHDDVYTDLFKRPLSSSSSGRKILKGDFYHKEKYFSGNEHTYPPSEGFTSDTVSSRACHQGAIVLKDEVN